jgi:hypothetical protein
MVGTGKRGQGVDLRVLKRCRFWKIEILVPVTLSQTDQQKTPHI